MEIDTSFLETWLEDSRESLEFWIKKSKEAEQQVVIAQNRVATLLAAIAALQDSKIDIKVD
jgi:hypothetical protein